MASKRLLHFGDRIVRAVRTRDADDFLPAVNAGKVVNAGEIWDGTQRYVDEVRGVLGRLDTPLTLGRTLHARELEQVVQLGRRWTGELEGRLAGSRDEDSDERRLREQALARTREKAARKPLVGDHLARSATTTRDTIRKMSQEASDFWARRHQRATHDAAPSGPNTHMRDRIAAMNCAARKLWSNR